MIHYKIGKIPIRKKGVLAPMADYTNYSFRSLCEKYGSGFLFTEMVHFSEIINTDKRTKVSETPCALQLVGDFRDKKIFDAIEKLDSKKYKILDFNFGCPSKKISASGGGASLLSHYQEAFKVIKEIKQTTDFAITVKTRLGFSENQIIDISKTLEKTNIDALSVHGRTAKENYSTNSDYESVRKIKNNISFPLIYNGDVSLDSFKFYLGFKEFDDVMIGREALRNPQIFYLINSYLENKDPKKHSKEKIIKDYLEIAKKNKENFNSQKLILLQLVSGLRGSKVMRNKICNSKSVDDFYSLFDF